MNGRDGKRMSPTVARWELALRVRERRDQLGVDVKSITTRLGFSRNYWSAVENERKLLSTEKLRALAELLECDEAEEAELFRLREEAKNHGWWSQYSGLFGSEQLRLYGLEHGAHSVRTYESVLIPGLLQTEDYARALIASDLANIRQVEVAQRVSVRRQRQQRLRDHSPLQLTAVISEAALRQHIGGAQVLREQLHHLVHVIDSCPDTIGVYVIPFTATPGGVLGASTFHLLDFPSPRLPTLAWQETVTAQNILDEPTHVRDLSMTHAQALAHCLDRDASSALIQQTADELDSAS